MATITAEPDEFERLFQSPSHIPHLYWVGDAEAARELGVQVQMLCGYWDWPWSWDDVVTTKTAGVDCCLRCVQILADAERAAR